MSEYSPTDTDSSRERGCERSYAYTLRDYQSQDVDRIRAALGRVRRVCYVLPTGGGKTVIFAYITYHTQAKGRRVTILAHRQEIADQISRALDAMGVAHGSIRPGEKPTDHPVQVAMVQTLANRLRRAKLLGESLPAPELLVIDEAHHAVARTWQGILEVWPKAFVLGVTATPERLDGAGLRDVGFEELVEGPDVATLIEQGHLAEFRYLGADIDVSFDDVRTIGGDFDLHEVEDRVSSKAVTGDVIAHYRKHLDGRTCIAFCVTVAHAHRMAAAYNAAGIPAASIDGSMTSDERRAVVDDLRTGRIKVLTSCEVISEGFDAPSVGGAQLLRPTQSFALFRQQIGRCLRPKEDGSEAVVLDHVQNYQRHGLPDDPHAWSLDSLKRTADQRKMRKPMRQCKACLAVFSINHRQPPCPGEPNCVFIPKRVEQTRPGELAEVVRLPAEKALEWANGIDLRTGWYRRLIILAAGQKYRLQQIAAARGYKAGWVWHQQQVYLRKEGVWEHPEGLGGPTP